MHVTKPLQCHKTHAHTEAQSSRMQPSKNHCNTAKTVIYWSTERKCSVL